MYEPCEKCRAGGDPWGAGGVPTKLTGGYSTALCNRHLNEWFQMIVETDEYNDLGLEQVRLDCSISVGDYDEAGERKLQVVYLEGKLYAIAKAWCQEPDEAGTAIEEGNDAC